MFRRTTLSRLRSSLEDLSFWNREVLGLLWVSSTWNETRDRKSREKMLVHKGIMPLLPEDDLKDWSGCSRLIWMQRWKVMQSLSENSNKTRDIIKLARLSLSPKRRTFLFRVGRWSQFTGIPKWYYTLKISKTYEIDFLKQWLTIIKF